MHAGPWSVVAAIVATVAVKQWPMRLQADWAEFEDCWLRPDAKYQQQRRDSE